MTRQVNAHLTDDQHARLEQQAKRRGTRASTLAREWLLEKLAEAEKDSAQ